MKRIQETATIGYSRYSLKPNSNGWSLFFVYTAKPNVYNMMSNLCSVPNIDDEISSYVKRRDFNYVEVTDIAKIYYKHFKYKGEDYDF